MSNDEIRATGEETNPERTVQVEHLHIEKFRAIRTADIHLGKTTALVGQNSSGKSSILRALNALFNFEAEAESFVNGSHSYSSSSQSLIEVAISGMKVSGLPLDGDTLRVRLKFRKAPVWEVKSTGRWIAAPSDLMSKVQESIQFVLIPIRRDWQVAHDPTEGLLGRLIEEKFNHNRQRDRISPQIAGVAGSFRSVTLAPLERSLQQIAPEMGPFRFKLEHTNPPDYQLLLQGMQLSVLEAGVQVPLRESGSGTQSMAVFALYSELAALAGVKYLLGFEEPEQNLHPQAQRQLVKSLQRLGLQVVFTTHSPTIVDALDHESVALCRRKIGDKGHLDVEVRQIGSDFFAKHSLDREKYYKFHRRQNSEFLFADYVVVTESPIDAVVVSQLLLDAGVDLLDMGGNIVPLDGVEAIPYMFFLLRELGIESAFIVDKDYFVPYRSNNVRKDSLDPHGLPKYSSIPKSGSLLEHLIPAEEDRVKLGGLLCTNHTQAMDVLNAVGFFCFNYSLEADLTCALTTREKLYDLLGLQGQGRTVRELLIGKRKNMKDQGVLVSAIARVPASQLPSSYKRIRRIIPEKAREAHARARGEL